MNHPATPLDPLSWVERARVFAALVEHCREIGDRANAKAAMLSTKTMLLLAVDAGEVTPAQALALREELLPVPSPATR